MNALIKMINIKIQRNKSRIESILFFNQLVPKLKNDLTEFVLLLKLLISSITASKSLYLYYLCGYLVMKYLFNRNLFFKIPNGGFKNYLKIMA